MASGYRGDAKANTIKRHGRWRTLRSWQLVLWLILFFPVGLFLVWRQDRWQKRTKWMITWATAAAALVVFAIAYIFAPPTVTVTSSLSPVKSESYTITGKVTPAGSAVTVNGSAATVKGDNFTASVKLNEGDNTLKVVAVKDNKRTEQQYKIHRYTKLEVIAQEKAAAQKKAAQAAAAKKKADAAAAKAKEEAAAAAAAEAAKKPAVTTPAAPKVTVTVSQKNALQKAKDYLAYTAFSHDGLIGQLEYEQFSLADATYAADNVGANWNEQAAKKAKDYMDYSSFSRGSLIDQLEYDKFTPDQAAYGATTVGL